MNVLMRNCTEGDLPVFAERLSEIIEMFPEFQWVTDKVTTARRILHSTASLDLWDELVVRDDDGRLIAFAILTDDEDAHVGQCLGVQWCMAFPEAPPWAIYRIHTAARRHARKCGYEIMAYTHRRGEGRYEINYVKV